MSYLKKFYGVAETEEDSKKRGKMYIPYIWFTHHLMSADWIFWRLLVAGEESMSEEREKMQVKDIDLRLVRLLEC